MRYTPLLFVIPLLSGCLATTHRYEDGRLLAPGETDVSMGYSSFPTIKYSCSNGAWNDSLGKCVEYRYNSYPLSQDSIEGQRNVHAISRYSLRYRLGVRRQWGPFTAVELGFQTEAVTNPVTHDFWLALGLPTGMADTSLRQAVYAGWGVGMWADNAWFAQYAGSWNWKAVSAFGSLRTTWMATQKQDLGNMDSAMKFLPHRRWSTQLALGARVSLPAIPVLPDWIGVQSTTEFPQYVPQDYHGTDQIGRIGSGTTLSVAMGWRYAP